MVKSSDQILILMQNTACSENILFNLPARVALLRSFDFWHGYDFYKNDRKAYYFSQIILNPKYFDQTDKSIAEKLFISEKSVQNYRKEFKVKFLHEYQQASTLDSDTLLSIDNAFFQFYGSNGFSSFIKNEKSLSFSSRVLRYFSDIDLQKIK